VPFTPGTPSTGFDDPVSPTIGAEFVAPSMSSEFPEALGPVVPLADALPNEQVRYVNGFLHGYLRCTVTGDGRSDTPVGR
jgi:hypothetical protein